MKRVLMSATVPSMIGQFNKDNIRLLLDLGYHVDVAADFLDSSIWPKERIDQFKQEMKSLGVDCIQLDFSRNILNIGRHFKSYKEASAIIRKRHYAFIHTHTPIASAVIRLAALRTKTRVIYTAHGFHFYKGGSLKNWILFYPVEKLLSSYTDILITITKEDYERARKEFHAKKVTYIPGVGVDIERFHPSTKNRAQIREELNISPDRFMLLSVGELNKNKNHEAVIRALKGADITYVIVGKGDLSTHLEETAREVGIDLRLMGFRSNVTDYYNAADAFVLPSLREGLNVSLMEAMASGLACSCGRIRGNTDLIEDTSCLFDPSNSDQIREAIQYVISHKELLGARNRKKITAFSITAVAEKMKHIYSDIYEDR